MTFSDKFSAGKLSIKLRVFIVSADETFVQLPNNKMLMRQNNKGIQDY